MREVTIYCDRCGAEANHDTEPKKVGNIDLCDDCSESFARFMDGLELVGEDPIEATEFSVGRRTVRVYYNVDVDGPGYDE